MIGHLGHFLLDFLAQIWTQGALRHMLGPILVIFETCHFLAIPGLFEYFSENGPVSENQSFLDEGVIVTPLSVSFRRRGPLAKSWANLFPNPKHLRGCYRPSKVKYPPF